MDAKIATIGLLLMIVIPVIFFISPSTEHCIVPASTTVFETGQEEENYSTNVTVDQKDLQLDHEVVTFKIIFHENDRINVSSFLMIQQFGTDFEPQACLLILTNGTASIFKKSNVSFLYYIPSAILFDATIFGHRIAFGGRVFYKLLNLTRFRIGVTKEQYNDVQVQKDDVWYLTMAEFNSKPGEALTIAVRSLSSSPSMELVQIDRHSDIGFYSALDNDFEGRYMGFKLPILPFGFSVANNLQKEVITSRGSVVYFCSVGHAKGRMKVETPNNRTYLNLNNGLALFSYCGNWTGIWNFSASGVGFPWKHNVMLFYADVDPHLKLRSG